MKEKQKKFNRLRIKSAMTKKQVVILNLIQNL